MGQLVFILGRSGTGKSYSMRNFPKEQLAVINVQGKILPFKGAGQIEQTPTDNSANILKALDIYAHDYKSIVIDDYQYLMANEFMRRSYEKGYDKFTEIGRHAWDIANKVRDLPDDVIVYIMCHTDRDDEGNEKIKTIGKLLDEKICLEGMSTIVLMTNVSDGQYTFLTQNNGKNTAKSPAGMFPTYAIDNDLWYVDQKIRNYYEIGDYTSDEDLAKIEEVVAKPEVEKPNGDGRKRRRKSGDAGSDTKDVSGTSESASSEGNAASEAVNNTKSDAEAPEQPKTRRRKNRTEPDEEVTKPEEKAPETAENAAQKAIDEALEEKPRRRRRRSNTITEDDINNTSVLDINDNDVPF